MNKDKNQDFDREFWTCLGYAAVAMIFAIDLGLIALFCLTIKGN